MGILSFTGSYGQDFDTLGAAGPNLAWTNGSTLEGWFLFRQPAAGPVAITAYDAGTGSSNAGKFYSFGGAADADRAFGGVGSGGGYFGSPASGSVAGWIALGARNDTGAAQDTLRLRFDGEQWRNGGNTTAQAMVLEYGFGADFASVAGWTPAGAAFSWASPVATGSSSALDGNDAANRVAEVGGTLGGLNWAAGDTLWLRWVEVNDSGNDHGLALDNLTLALPGRIDITEVLYSGDDGEYIEFTNVGASPVDFSGYSFDDDSRTPGTVALDAIGVLAPGASAILTEADEAAFRSAWSLSPQVKVIGGNTTNLGRNDEVNLFDAAGALVDRLSFGDQNFPGTVRAQDRSAWAGPDDLGGETITPAWVLSSVGDAQNARSSAGGDTGSPGLFNDGSPGVAFVESAAASVVAEGGASDTYTVVLRSMPTADVTLTLDGGAQLQTDVTSLTFTPTDWMLPRSVTVSAVDDALDEGAHTGSIAHTLSSADAAYDGLAVADLGVSILDNEAPLPRLSLSLNRSSGSEADATWVTVTVTASRPVVGEQSVTLSVGGAGIAADDYLVDGSTLTLADGQTQASLRFVVQDDAIAEPDETVEFRIENPSVGVVLGDQDTAELGIVDNEASLLTRIGGAGSANGAEIAAFDPGSDRLFVVAGSVVEVYTMSAAGALTLAGAVAPGFAPAGGASAVPNSVAAKNGIAAVAWAQVVDASDAQLQGHVSLYDAASGALLNDLEVGYLPDMLTFSPDGSRIVVANEGEPNSYGQPDSFDPEGSVSIIDLAGGVAGAVVRSADFTAFDAQAAALRAAGVRIFGPGATVAQDLEPEYVAISTDGASARVTLQENNAVAIVDLDRAIVTDIVPLGAKDFSAPGAGLDPSDRDSASNDGINIANWPVLGLTMPDAIAGFSVGGRTYYITANEGDARDYDGFAEELRVGSAAYVLDPAQFPGAAALKDNAALGRLTVTNASGDTDGDGDFDHIETFGARSVTVWDEAGTVVWDSGDALERITAERTPQLFNSSGEQDSFDGRSDNKGPEPEGVAIGSIGSHTYAFVGLERSGDVVVFDVSRPDAPSFVQLINRPEDVGPEGLLFVPAADSPTGAALLVMSSEVSRTVTVFEIDTPLRIADIQGAAHRSLLVGQGVTEVPGKVTAVASNGFYLQDPTPDADAATSDAIFVFTGSAPTVTVGDAVKVSGTVAEFRPGNAPTNLTVTEIVHDNAVQALVVAPWTDAPAGAIEPLMLGVDRVAPTAVINGDGSVDVETAGDFEPAVDGIDFYESLEGMLVRVDDAQVVSPTNSFGEIWVLPEGGAGASGLTPRGGILVSEGDFNPERLQLDNLLASQTLPSVDVGARLDPVTGVIDYAFGNFELRTLTTPTVAQPSTLEREVTALTPGAGQLTVGTFNVENLDPADGAAKFDALAAAIVGNLASPDILSLEEVQDNSGALDNGVVAADQTLQLLIDAIVDAGGPTYAYRQIDPANNSSGGQPGGNIRVAFLYNPARVDFVDGSLRNLTDTDLADGDAFAGSRKPLVGDFVFNGETVTLVANHFASKGGDQPLFGPQQPPLLPSEAQRLQQADAVADFVAVRLAGDAQARLLVLGDLNDFEFSPPLAALEGAGLETLVESLSAAERYSYDFAGNAQALDHILASDAMMDRLDAFDVVHINSEFVDQVSDHDPLVARFDFALPRVVAGTPGRDLLVGGDGPDRLTGGGGRDLMAGGGAGDTFAYRSLADLTDLITDFLPGEDRLDVAELMAAVGAGAADPVDDGFLSVVALSAPLPGGSPIPLASVVLFDPDGEAGPDVGRPLVVLVGVSIDQAQDLLGGN